MASPYGSYFPANCRYGPILPVKVGPLTFLECNLPDYYLFRLTVYYLFHGLPKGILLAYFPCSPVPAHDSSHCNCRTDPGRCSAYQALNVH